MCTGLNEDRYQSRLTRLSAWSSGHLTRGGDGKQGTNPKRKTTVLISKVYF